MAQCYDEKYDFSLTKSGRKLKSGKSKKKQKNNSPSCYNQKHIRVKLSKKAWTERKTQLRAVKEIKKSVIGAR